MIHCTTKATRGALPRPSKHRRGSTDAVPAKSREERRPPIPDSISRRTSSDTSNPLPMAGNRARERLRPPPCVGSVRFPPGDDRFDVGDSMKMRSSSPGGRVNSIDPSPIMSSSAGFEKARAARKARVPGHVRNGGRGGGCGFYGFRCGVGAVWARRSWARGRVRGRRLSPRSVPVSVPVSKQVAGSVLKLGAARAQVHSRWAWPRLVWGGDEAGGDEGGAAVVLGGGALRGEGASASGSSTNFSITCRRAKSTWCESKSSMSMMSSLSDGGLAGRFNGGTADSKISLARVSRSIRDYKQMPLFFHQL